MRCRKSTRRINRREDRRLHFFNPFLMGNQLPCESLIVIVEVDVLMIFDSQEVKLDPKPLFSEKVNKKFHDMESNAFSKSIFNNKPGVFDLVKELMISKAVM